MLQNSIAGHWHGTIGDVLAAHATHDKQSVFDLTTAASAHFILKQVLEHPTRERLMSEYQVLAHLQAAGVPVSIPLLSDQGTSFVEDAGGIYTLTPALPRDDIFDPDAYPAQYTNIGRAIGKLHRALAAYPGEIVSWTMDLPGRVRKDLVPVLTARLESHERAMFEPCVVARMDEICDALADLPVHHIHGDCHGGNVLLYHGDVSGFIDLDHLPIGPRIYDLSYFLADRVKNAIYDPAALRAWLDQFDGLIAGYESEIVLTPREKHALWYGMVVSQLLFVYWFLEHQNAAHVTKNLAVLDWICEHQQEIESKIYAKP